MAQHVAVREWLHRWTLGKSSQPTLYQDPATGQWRGPTRDEIARRRAEAE